MAGWLIGAGGIAAAAAAGWHSMSPTSQLYGRTFTGVARGTRVLALTFDDGPNHPWTPRLLDVLARRDIRATFFLVGRYVREQPAIARAVAAAGHEIGNHTSSHPNLIFTSPAQLREEIADCARSLTDAGITAAPLFRPPFGARRPDVLRTIADAGLRTIMWRASSYDWKLPTARAIVARVVRQIRGGEVILMHDGSHTKMGADRSQSVAAADELIRRYKGDGFRFLTISEMMRAGAP
jgi:peptidoglycan/xylan/chitin deacetylase (PgdA/CDA1 family)